MNHNTFIAGYYFPTNNGDFIDKEIFLYLFFTFSISLLTINNISMFAIPHRTLHVHRIVCSPKDWRPSYIGI